jgi:hypothetical protein
VALRQVLAAADELNEVIFVADRTADAHAPRNARGREGDANDALSALPAALEAVLLPLIRSRPLVLRRKLARYAAAQVLDRIVASLPNPPDLAELAAAAGSRVHGTGAAALSPVGGSLSGRRPKQKKKMKKKGLVPVDKLAEAAAKARAAFVRKYFEEKVRPPLPPTPARRELWRRRPSPRDPRDPVLTAAASEKRRFFPLQTL